MAIGFGLTVDVRGGMMERWNEDDANRYISPSSKLTVPVKPQPRLHDHQFWSNAGLENFEIWVFGYRFF